MRTTTEDDVRRIFFMVAAGIPFVASILDDDDNVMLSTELYHPEEVSDNWAQWTVGVVQQPESVFIKEMVLDFPALGLRIHHPDASGKYTGGSKWTFSYSIGIGPGSSPLTSGCEEYRSDAYAYPFPVGV